MVTVPLRSGRTDTWASSNSMSPDKRARGPDRRMRAAPLLTLHLPRRLGRALGESRGLCAPGSSRGGLRTLPRTGFLPAGVQPAVSERGAARVGGPFRIFHGAEDNWTPAGPCRELAERLRAAGHDVRMVAFDGHTMGSTRLAPAQLLRERNSRKDGSPGRARTCDILINSQALYRLSYRGVTRDSTYDRAGNWGEVYQTPAAPVAASTDGAED